jgi:hypothetical protein
MYLLAGAPLWYIEAGCMQVEEAEDAAGAKGWLALDMYGLGAAAGSS